AAAQAGQRPKRSIIFAAWNSEERGLLGAWAYTEFPVVPLDRIVVNLNMDMIGRNEEVQVGGGPRSGQPGDWPRAQVPLRQQRLQLDAAQRPLAVLTARRAWCLGAHRPAPGLPHAIRPA